MQSISIGLISVLAVFCLIYIAVGTGWLSYILVNIQFDRDILIAAAFYFGMRVPRDIGILILWNLGLKAVLTIVYFSELTLIFSILADPVFDVSGSDIFNSMASACLLAVTIIIGLLLSVKRLHKI